MSDWWLWVALGAVCLVTITLIVRARRWWSRPLASLVGIWLVALSILGSELVAGDTPALGLDLQGGVSVTLEPEEDVTADQLGLVSDIVRNAVDSLGIAEPDVRVEGGAIVVDLPGVKDQQEAMELVNVTGEVTLQPVLQPCSQTPVPLAEDDAETATTDTTAATTTTTNQSTSTPTTSSTASTQPPAGSQATTSVAADQLMNPATPPTDSDTDGTQPATGTTGTATTSAAATTAAAPATTTPPVPTAPGNVPGPVIPETTTTTPSESPAEQGDLRRSDFPIEQADGSMIALTQDDRTCVLGPSGGSGEVFSRDSASATIEQGAWIVTANLSGEGSASWNALASQCYSGQPTCPTRRLAIVLDGVVQSSPEVQAPQFEGTVSITGMEGESEARDLSAVINRGAYPFELKPVRPQTVSPSLGQDTLFAAILAGAIGIGLVLIALLAYYRTLALVLVAGLTLFGVLMFAVITFLSAQRNLALSLSGAAGIIVSIGITCDSYVVFFERIKDGLRQGRSLRNAAPEAFTAAWRTNLNGNIAALIGALVLFWLSIGSVRGFALFLAIATVVDLIVLWFFTRPAVLLLARSSRFGERRLLGVAPASAGEQAS